MCGIVGLFAKTPEVEANLGALLAPMLYEMSDRGPDSAGVAFYRNPVASGNTKLTLQCDNPHHDWELMRDALADRFGADKDVVRRANHAVLVAHDEAAPVEAWIEEQFPEVKIMSAGEAIEIYKETGRPEKFIETFDIQSLNGTHALGHTRMATESKVTTAGSHPFSTGLDLCLVHNGSLSNHNGLRRMLRREGIRFQTENDTEVAAGYMMWRQREGDSMQAMMDNAFEDLDGFYTFLIGTRDGFAVVRDPIACKPAVIAETDEWVAMSSEYRSIATLPGAEKAKTWEPAPATIYAWEKEKV
ncbi:MAG: amidophosphoribosyltransferase [Actinobacteria bacterium]|nr:amidophosphoribosyltransferase [Actinomycetota bacterium]